MCDLLRINTDRGVMIEDGKSRFSIGGKTIYHFVGTSTFSEYTVMHVGCVAKINPEAPLDKVCVLSCGISTGLGASINVAKPPKGSTVAIFGLRVVGLAVVEGARIAGASRIIGVDLKASRFEEARKFGCTEFVNPKDHTKPVQQVLADMTNGGVDRSVECTGNVNAMIQAFECVHDGWGVAVLVGVPHKDAEFKTHPMNFLNERILKGIFFGNFKPRTDLPNVVEMYMKLCWRSCPHTTARGRWCWPCRRGSSKEVNADKLGTQQRIASVGDDHECFLSKFKDRVNRLLEQLILHLTVQVQDPSVRHAHVVNALRRFKVD
ncbi:alcohol dehydrogenase 1 [Hordeum vulgare]|nr:alcohol dehydrogenase 1 [Hordeum vulgare]